MKKTLLSLCAVMALSSTSIVADEILDQMNDAIKAYQDKDYKGAMEELKFITAQLQKLDTTENQKLLPQALEGWKIEQSDNHGEQAMMSMMGGGTSMEATYKKDKESIKIQILANSPMLAMMSMAISNPALMASDPNTSPYRYKRNKGMKKKKGNETEIVLLISGQIMIKLTGTHLKNDAILEQYLDGIDIKELKNQLL